MFQKTTQWYYMAAKQCDMSQLKDEQTEMSQI